MVRQAIKATVPAYLGPLLRSWVPARIERCAEREIGVSPGGGRRLNAAYLYGDESVQQLTSIADHMDKLGMEPLFMVPSGSHPEELLKKQGYLGEAPTSLYCLAVDGGANAKPDISLYRSERPIAWMVRFWGENGVVVARQEAMARAEDRTYLFARSGEQIGAAGFLSCSGNLAMMHALVVAPKERGNGLARALVKACAKHAAEKGSDRLLWLTEDNNENAHRAFAKIGAQCETAYQYYKRT